MADKQLKNKAIDIKGKKYVLVSDRVLYFNETYPNGSIVTNMIQSGDESMVIIKAIITPDCSNPDRIFTGYSQAKWGEGFINKTAALENAETSAVGRALAMMGIGVIDSIASVDEINKAKCDTPYTKPIFGEKNLEKLTREKDKYTFDDVWKTIHDNYSIDTTMEHKVMELYGKGAGDLF